MNKNYLAILGFASLLPAIILVSCGLTGAEVPQYLVHPVIVMGGLFASLLLNAFPVLRFRLSQDEGEIVGTATVRVQGRVLNLAALILSSCLLGVIVLYLFLENFHTR
jgi:hypothetical protein